MENDSSFGRRQSFPIFRLCHISQNQLVDFLVDAEGFGFDNDGASANGNQFFIGNFFNAVITDAVTGRNGKALQIIMSGNERQGMDSSLDFIVTSQQVVLARVNFASFVANVGKPIINASFFLFVFVAEKFD